MKYCQPQFIDEKSETDKIWIPHLLSHTSQSTAGCYKKWTPNLSGLTSETFLLISRSDAEAGRAGGERSILHKVSQGHSLLPPPPGSCSQVPQVFPVQPAEGRREWRWHTAGHFSWLRLGCISHHHLNSFLWLEFRVSVTSKLQGGVTVAILGAGIHSLQTHCWETAGLGQRPQAPAPKLLALTCCRIHMCISPSDSPVSPAGWLPADWKTTSLIYSCT